MHIGDKMLTGNKINRVELLSYEFNNILFKSFNTNYQSMS